MGPGDNVSGPHAFLFWPLTPYHWYYFLIALASRLFCRAAVFLWINPLRPERSRSLVASR